VNIDKNDVKKYFGVLKTNEELKEEV